MTGPEHWEEADLILREDPCEYGCPHSGCAHELRQLARAQVHAQLALVAAIASARLGEMPAWDADAWQAVTGIRDTAPAAADEERR